MNLSESIASLVSRLSDINKKEFLLKEAKGHTDHPEDLVFLQGQFGAERAIQAIIDTVKNPKAITIKMDGYPALIWGYGPDGKFSVMDKHMFNKGSNSNARYIHSPQEFMQYDKDRGVDRSDLANTLQKVWSELQQVTPKKQGYYWGDLMFKEPLQVQKDGLFHFQANPNGIRYTVDPESEAGKRYFDNKDVGIAVHQTLPVGAESTDDAEHLEGSLGDLKQGKRLSLMPVNMPIVPKLELDNGLVQQANATVQKYGPELDNFFSTPPQAIEAFTTLFTSYINKRIVSKNLQNLTDGFFNYVSQKPMTDSMRRKLLGYEDPQTGKHVPGYLDGNRETIEHIFQIWIDIYNLKMSIVPQLDKAALESPVQGYLQNGNKSQEGFYSHGLKMVNRVGFSAQNLAGQR